MRGIFLFQRDLRVTDQMGLSKALESCDELLLAAVFDPMLHKLPIDSLENESFDIGFNVLERLSAVIQLENFLRSQGKAFHVHIGSMIPWLLEICKVHKIDAVWLNKVYEPMFLSAYEKLHSELNKLGVSLTCCDDYGVPQALLNKADGSIYKVFTPFYKNWRRQLSLEQLSPFIPYWNKVHNYISVEAPNPHWDQLKEAVLQHKDYSFCKNEVAYQIQWQNFLNHKIQTYLIDREYPALDGTSQMSIAINNGIISYRQLVREAMSHPEGEGFLRQLAWRQFYQMILIHYPEVEYESFRKEYRDLKWPNDERLFQKWKDGRTGFAIVDAAMTQLKKEGRMHNRLRMITASLLVKQLGVDWRLGEAYFYEMLRDGDLALNNGGWQWCASTGTDAQPYFRIFNPLRQGERYDAENHYINRWLDEVSAPCVDLKTMSQWAIKLYKNAKEGASKDESI